MVAPVLSELDRRVLGHLPAWAADEAAHIESEGGPELSIRTYGLIEFTARLAEDPNAVGMDLTGASRHLTAPEVAAVLADLVERGLAARDDIGTEGQDGFQARWRMTAEGFNELTGPERKPGQIPGPVEVPLNPAVHDSAAAGGITT